MIETKHLRISGKVQGVGFRAAMYREAVRLNVMEAVIQGPEKSVAAMLAWAHRGPPGARVDKIDEKPVDGIFPDFDLLSTV
jgi:acylphosphatase